jgi:VWFA-related protein
MPTGIYSRFTGMLFAFVIGGAALCAQQPEGIQKENGVYTLHEDTHLVLLDVTVMDKQGHPVTGLTKDDFKLLEDGQPQTIKFFEEHVPVDAAEIARQKAAAIAGQPPNTFTNYEPFSGRPVTLLVLNQLFRLDRVSRIRVSPFQLDMLDLVRNSPPDTPFAVYVLGSELRLVQPVTTDRSLLAAKILGIDIWNTPDIGSERPTNPDTKAPMSVDDAIGARRGFVTSAMQQLTAALKDTPGRKSLFFFTGAFQCSVVLSDGTAGVPPCPEYGHFGHDREFLCGLEDTLEQGRIWIYRYYGPDQIGYGFGCGSTGANVRDLSHYYTLYYTPTNRDWSGKYRATTVEVADKGLHLAYRKGYYGTPENVEAHYYTANGSATAPVTPSAGGSTVTATVVATGTADSASPSADSTEARSTQQVQLRRRDSESLGSGAAKAAPNPASSVFSVQVIPADTTVVPDAAKSAGDKEKQEYRQLTLHFSMPANEFKVVRSDGGQYVARLLISAVGYSDGKVASSNGSQAVQMAVNLDGAADPRIANSTITATLTLNVLEHGKNRWLYVSVRDMVTGQLGNMVIPMEQVKMQGTQ